MAIAVLGLLLLADASGPPRVPRPERLGNVYTYLGTAVDRGLTVEEWRNETLGRTELWYKPDAGEYYLRVDATTYVHGRHDGSEWVTVPAERMVYRNGKWTKGVSRYRRGTSAGRSSFPFPAQPAQSYWPLPSQTRHALTPRPEQT